MPARARSRIAAGSTITGAMASTGFMILTVMASQPRIIWEKENAGWQTWDPPLPSHVKSMATLGQRTVLSQIRGKIAYVVLREPGTSTLSLAQWEGSAFKPITTITGENLEG